MEPLVIFGAGLVIWCGCLSAADAVRELKTLRQAGPVRRKVAKKRVSAVAAGAGAGMPGGISCVRPHMQRG